MAFCAPVALVAAGVGLNLWLLLDAPNWWVIALCAIMALACGLPAMVTATMLVLPRGITGDVEITSESVHIHDRGRTVKLARDDVKSVRVVYMRKPGRQLHAKTDWPWQRGRGDGIAIETPHGTFKTLDWWHHEVSQWLARLLSEYGSVTLTDDEGIERAVSEEPVSRGMPYRIPRKDLTAIGVCLLLVGGAFGWLSWSTVRDSWEAREWKSVAGVIDSIDTVERDGNRSRLVVTYRYVVQGATYTNDRFRLDDGSHSARAERRKASLVVGNTIEVWYDPDDPQRSTVERDFAIFGSSLFLVSIGMGLAGIVALIYSAIGKHSVLAEYYVSSREANGPARGQHTS